MLYKLIIADTHPLYVVIQYSYLSLRLNYPTVHANNKHVWSLTFEILFTTGLAIDMLVLLHSSAGGGKTFPERPFILFVAPIIC